MTDQSQQTEPVPVDYPVSYRTEQDDALDAEYLTALDDKTLLGAWRLTVGNRSYSEAKKVLIGDEIARRFEALIEGETQKD